MIRKVFILPNNEFLELLQKELQDINVTLEMNQKMLNKCTTKSKKYPIFKKLRNNIKNVLKYSKSLGILKKEKLISQKNIYKNI